MAPIFLIGFMGSGKTTLGRALAAASCSAPNGRNVRPLRFIDLDEYIRQKEGMSIREIFDLRGEKWFRCRETLALRELSALSDVVIACGGGTPCHSGNMELMNSVGHTVMLRASHQALMRRLTEAQEQRPLLRGLNPEELARFISQKLAEREPYYSQATTEFPSDLLETPEEVALSCARFFSLPIFNLQS